jgi:hypothetical protein
MWRNYGTKATTTASSSPSALDWFMLVVVVALACLIQTSVKADVPSLRFYCSTAEPLGLTYTDLVRGIHT